MADVFDKLEKIWNIEKHGSIILRYDGKQWAVFHGTGSVQYISLADPENAADVLLRKLRDEVETKRAGFEAGLAALDRRLNELVV